jgi:hypothetical protein
MQVAGFAWSGSSEFKQLVSVAAEMVAEYSKSKFRSEEERKELRQQLDAFAPAFAAFAQESDLMFEAQQRGSCYDLRRLAGCIRAVRDTAVGIFAVFKDVPQTIALEYTRHAQMEGSEVLLLCRSDVGRTAKVQEPVQETEVPSADVAGGEAFAGTHGTTASTPVSRCGSSVSGDLASWQVACRWWRWGRVMSPGKGAYRTVALRSRL